MTPTLVAILAFCHSTARPVAFSPPAICVEFMKGCVETKARELWAQGFDWSKDGVMHDCTIEYNSEPFKRPFYE